MADPTESVAGLATAVVAGEARALARAITLLESERPTDQARADELLSALLPHTGHSLRLGLSGPPGAGKSTLLDALGRHAIAEGERVAVLAVDPSSAVHGGSLLGDKTRMSRLSQEPASFIRPSPSRGNPGGVGPRSREALFACEAAGYSVVMVETLGVGQGEHAAADLVDCLVLVLAPGGGDEIQAMKRGILELSDVLVVNKADGPELVRAEVVAFELAGALSLLEQAGLGAAPSVLTVSALEGRGIAELWHGVTAHVERAKASGAFARRRAAGMRSWLHRKLDAELARRWLSRPGVAAVLAELEREVEAGTLVPRRAVERLLASG